MVNPAAIRSDMPGDFLHQQAIPARRAWLLINYGILFISVAGLAIIRTTVISNTLAVGGPVYHVMAAFLLFLLGVSMLMLGLAADQFPGAARFGRATVRAFNQYQFGGGN